MSLEHWESYYRGGALVSCPMGLEPGYTREVRDAWVAFFAGLPDGARILDLATGNGAIPVIAREAAAALGYRFAIDAIDLAQIDPLKHVADAARLFEGVNFHAGVSAEALPFEAGSFAALSGQYALEYMDAERALAEAHRVLKPGGLAQFVLHHRDSVIVLNAHESLRLAALVLDETKVFRLFKRYVEAETATPGRAQGPWQELVATGERLQLAARTSHNSLLLTMTLDSMRKLFDMRGKVSLPALEAAVDDMEKNLRASVRRLHDLVGAARSQEDIAALVAIAERVGFTDARYRAQLHSGDKLVGWRLNLTRP